MKKLCGLVLALLMIFGMVGCSGENPTASQDSTPTSDTTADTSIIESSADESSTDDLVSNNTSQTLVVYFSCTGNTKEAAEEISQQINADIFEIVPEVPYTTEDLNYNNDNCRAIQEMNDDSARPAISSQIEDLENYDTVFIGYPISVSYTHLSTAI